MRQHHLILNFEVTIDVWEVAKIREIPRALHPVSPNGYILYNYSTILNQEIDMGKYVYIVL